jgi:uncharacterized protein (TIGR03067 family)
VRMNLATMAAAGVMLAGVNPQEDAVKKEVGKLLGTWTSEVINLDDEKRWTELKITEKGISWEGSSLKLGAPFGRTGVVRYTYRLKPDQQPQEIELTWMEFSNKGKVQLGIYRLDGDTLKICVSQIGNKRPKEFKSREEPRQSLLTLKRVRP